MRIVRVLAVFCLLFATSAISASSIPTQFDGGDPPPMCAPGDPNCKPV